MADFKQAFAIVEQHEGGYTNDSRDPGGETYRGIARRFWSSWEGWGTIDATTVKLGYVTTLDCDGDVRKTINSALAGISGLIAAVENFYLNNFWNVLALYNEPDQMAANKVFDMAVNIGVKKAKEFYEESKT